MIKRLLIKESRDRRWETTKFNQLLFIYKKKIEESNSSDDSTLRHRGVGVSRHISISTRNNSTIGFFTHQIAPT